MPELEDPAGDVTRLLRARADGDAEAYERLFPLVYDRLRRLARAQLARGRPGATLDTSALVHEAFLKLGGGVDLAQTDRAHFFAYAARVMRHLIVDDARARQAQKRGGAFARITLEPMALSAGDPADTLVALDEALTRLAALNERLARVVECRFFAGLTEEETAEALGVTDRTVRRDWVKARAWLYDAMRE